MELSMVQVYYCLQLDAVLQWSWAWYKCIIVYN